MRAIMISEGSYWDETSPYFSEYQEFWNELVPPMGEAETLQGELLRMMSRIMHDYYNNGFGNNKREEALFLDEHSNLFKHHMKDPHIWDAFFNSYEEINFGDYAGIELMQNRYGIRFDLMYDEEDEDDYENETQEYIEQYIKNWNVEEQMDMIMDGIVKYIRLTKDKLQPL